MAQPHVQVIVAAWPDAEAETDQLRIPDAVLARTQRQIALCEVAVEQCPVPGLLPDGEHMAIIVSETVRQSRGIARFPGDHAANIGTPTVEGGRRLTD